jgi:putative ABC transport system substrate-binding protein
MRRRDFISLLGIAAAWPLAARAQQAERVRRVGVLIGYEEEDPEGQARARALRKGLTALGWVDQQNIQFIFRWAGDDVERVRTYAADLTGANPDVIVAQSTTILRRLMQATGKVPIIFVTGADPVGAGIVPNLAQPGGNVTGFLAFENATSAKWLETLLEIVPTVSRVLIIQNARNPTRRDFLPAIEALGTASNIRLVNPELEHSADIEKAVEAFARESNGGVVVLPSAFTNVHRRTLVALAALHRLPAVYPFRHFAVEGGLITYGPEPLDLWRRAASYVDRILKGEKAGDLPVQQPTKYELVINLKTAKALGLAVPPSLLARADEVIE